MPNYTKTCSFLHAHCTETLKSSYESCETLIDGEKHSFIEWTYVVSTLIEAIPMLQTTYVTEIKETYFEYTVNVLKLRTLKNNYFFPLFVILEITFQKKC